MRGAVDATVIQRNGHLPLEKTQFANYSLQVSKLCAAGTMARSCTSVPKSFTSCQSLGWTCHNPRRDCKAYAAIGLPMRMIASDTQVHEQQRPHDASDGGFPTYDVSQNSVSGSRLDSSCSRGGHEDAVKRREQFLTLHVATR